MKRYLFTVMILILLIMPATGCRQTPKATTVSNDLKSMAITLERTNCKAQCPWYKLSISGNGTADYEGVTNVKVVGYYRTSLSEEKIEQLVSEVQKVDYFSLSDNYTEHVIADAPFVLTSVTMGGKTKTINHYTGDTNAPAKLVEFENSIDEILNTDQLVK